MRVLVVDDEIYTREGILESVDWEALGVDDVMDADDGLTALSIVEWFCPDIVISDVKMPQMDGITFARQFLEAHPDCKIIFMSAYMEIRYYQQAIKLSAVDYVEKPLDMDEMVRAIEKAVKGIRENREKREGQQRGRLMLEEQTVNYLVNPRRKLPRCRELCQEAGFPQEGYYICLCFRDLEKEDDKQTVISAIREFFSERKLMSLTAKADNYCYCCILAMNGISRDRYSMPELGGQFVNQYPSFQIGIGFYVEQLNAISESWRLSLDALNQAFYAPQRMVFEKVKLETEGQVVDSGIYSRVNQAMANEAMKLPVILNAIFSDFEKGRTLSPASIKAFAKAVVMDILRQTGNAEDIRREVFYGQPDLGLAEIAEESGISTGYLSMVFKKETGITVRQYIEDYRIEVAKDRLMHTNDRVQDISASCGFAQHGYFSRVFKQKTGMTPAEFREKHYGRQI